MANNSSAIRISRSPTRGSILIKSVGSWHGAGMGATNPDLNLRYSGPPYDGRLARMPLILILVILLLLFGGGGYYMGPGLGYYGGGGVSLVLLIVILFLLFGRGRGRL